MTVPPFVPQYTVWLVSHRLDYFYLPPPPKTNSVTRADTAYPFWVSHLCLQHVSSYITSCTPAPRPEAEISAKSIKTARGPSLGRDGNKPQNCSRVVTGGWVLGVGGGVQRGWWTDWHGLHVINRGLTSRGNVASVRFVEIEYCLTAFLQIWLLF